LPVCDECLAQMRPITGSVCSVCSERLASPFAAAGERCGLCRRAAPPFAKAAAYGSYDGGLRGLIHLLKYDQVRPAAGVLGRMLAQAISNLAVGSEEILVIPVPLHRHKLRQRGFNQAELITRKADWRGALRTKARHFGTPPRNAVPDWTDAAPAAGEHARGVCCCETGCGEGPGYPDRG
jgi:predicted amidophosphoribosyltransferase